VLENPSPMPLNFKVVAVLPKVERRRVSCSGTSLPTLERRVVADLEISAEIWDLASIKVSPERSTSMSSCLIPITPRIPNTTGLDLGFGKATKRQYLRPSSSVKWPVMELIWRPSFLSCF